MKRLTTTLLTILLSVSLFAQESEEFSAEYTFYTQATKETLISRARFFFQDETQYNEFGARTPEIFGNSVISTIDRKYRNSIEYREKKYDVKIEFRVRIYCEDNEYRVKFYRVTTSVERNLEAYILGQIITSEITERDPRRAFFLRKSSEIATATIENDTLIRIKGVMNNPIIENWSFQEE